MSDQIRCICGCGTYIRRDGTRRRGQPAKATWQEARDATIIAEWAYPAKGRHAFTWRITKTEHDGYALTSDTSEPGTHTPFIIRLTRARAFRIAERSARKMNATRII